MRCPVCKIERDQNEFKIKKNGKVNDRCVHCCEESKKNRLKHMNLEKYNELINETGSKHCDYCHCDKDLSEFGIKFTGKRNNMCKDCSIERNKSKYKASASP